MADKFTEFAGRMGKAPKGVGTGLKLLAAAAAVAYGVKESIYTGVVFIPCVPCVMNLTSYCLHDARFTRARSILFLIGLEKLARASRDKIRTQIESWKNILFCLDLLLICCKLFEETKHYQKFYYV